VRRSMLGRVCSAGLVAAVTATALTFGGPAYAAALEKVPNFGVNPGGLTMYVYRPDGLATGAPAVVLMHGCAMQASGLDTATGWRKYADQDKFALILPEEPNAGCFSFGDARGQGDAASIASMVGYAKATYGTDPKRVFATGFSAGGAMTSTMLATYPDLFAAGSVLAGIPYQCSSTADCTGDLVTKAFPGFTGQRPRVQIWHGTADTIVSVSNADGSRKQWTEVLHTGTTPARTEQLKGQTTKSSFTDASGRIEVEDYRLDGMWHWIPIDPGSGASQCGGFGPTTVRICYAYYAAVFFGLTKAVPAPAGADQQAREPGREISPA
jgi:poly(hydroxyalkanoate) depolymerase family esterase